MDADDHARATQAVADYRRASANLRRNNASTFAMAANERVLNAHDANAHVLGRASRTLTDLGLFELAEALSLVHRYLPLLAVARDEGREARIEHLSGELSAARRIVRSELARIAP